MAPKGELSHAEIWDDSALVNSWNDALEEYKKYHSLAARGENIEDVLARAETDGHGEDDETKLHDGIPEDRTTTVSDPPASETQLKGNAKDGHNDKAQETVSSYHDTPQEPESKQPALPQHLIGQVHDEGLKNLLMSWYYAGYYTGLYEGQQQGKASQGSDRVE